MEESTKRLVLFFLFPLLVVAGLVYIANKELRPDYIMTVSYYDVGQGDATLIETYQGNQVLIDGGPSDAVLSKLGADLPFYDRSLDAVILTHPHADHLSGLLDVLKRYRVERILMPRFTEAESSEFREFLRLADEKKIPIDYLRTGQRIYLDAATVFDVLSPQDNVMGAVTDKSSGEGKGVNDGSLVGRLSFGKTKFFFAADAGASVENFLDNHFSLTADVLKVGHHGSSSSSSTEFLDKVKPAYAVIEVGENRYGHPSEETLKRIEAAGVMVLRTDREGTIKFSSDGSIVFKNYDEYHGRTF